MPLGHWQPREFVRFEDSFSTSIGTARIVTDQGRAYIKPMGNPQGPHPLACEWVGTRLADWFGLPTFDYAIMQVRPDDEIPLKRGAAQAAAGPAFVTRAQQGDVWSGTTDDLNALSNPGAVSRLVVFDTWTTNCDRHPPDPCTRRPNRDNVFLSFEDQPAGQVGLVAMDHTHCFTCGDDLTPPRLRPIGRIRDEGVYGLFPEFAPLLQRDEVHASVQRLAQVDQRHVTSVVASVPREWQVAQPAQDALVYFIVERARQVAATIVAALEPHFLPRRSDINLEVLS